MQKISRKDIQTSVQSIIEQTLATYQIPSPSSKPKKLVKEVTKKISNYLKKELKAKLKSDKKVAKRQAKISKVKKITKAA